MTTANGGKNFDTRTKQWARERSRNSDWLRAGISDDLIPMGARFSTPV